MLLVAITTALLNDCSEYLPAGDPITSDHRALVKAWWSCSWRMVQIQGTDRAETREKREY